jgi:hypothetical protein
MTASFSSMTATRSLERSPAGSDVHSVQPVREGSLDTEPSNASAADTKPGTQEEKESNTNVGKKSFGPEMPTLGSLTTLLTDSWATWPGQYLPCFIFNPY